MIGIVTPETTVSQHLPETRMVAAGGRDIAHEGDDLTPSSIARRGWRAIIRREGGASLTLQHWMDIVALSKGSIPERDRRHLGLVPEIAAHLGWRDLRFIGCRPNRRVRASSNDS